MTTLDMESVGADSFTNDTPPTEDNHIGQTAWAIRDINWRFVFNAQHYGAYAFLSPSRAFASSLQAARQRDFLLAVLCSCCAYCFEPQKTDITVSVRISAGRSCWGLSQSYNRMQQQTQIAET